MAILGLTKLARDLEHRNGLVAELRAAPTDVLGRYDISETEVRAVLELDAHALLAAGMNPVALRNLLVLLGIPHGAMYTHDQSISDLPAAPATEQGS